MADPPALKRPKLEKDDDNDSTHWPRPSANGAAHVPFVASASAAANGAPPDDEDEEPMEEEAVVALIAHRERDVERCKLKLLHYQSLLDTAEMKLAEAQSRLARYRDSEPPSRQTEPSAVPIKREPKPSPPPIQRDPKPPPPPPEKKAPAPTPQPAARPHLVIPGTNNRPAPRPEPMPGLKKAAASSSSSSPAPPLERSRKEEKKPKRKIAEKEHQNLIPSIKKSSATVLRFQGGTLVSSQHKRKLRCLELCPANDQLVVTSALDGLVTLWQVEPRGYDFLHFFHA